MGSLVVVGQLVEDLFAGLGLVVSVVKEALTADSSGEVHVLLHDCDSLGMDGAQVSVFVDTNHVRLQGLLQGKESL